jgi:hypothetical protein
MLNTLRQIYPSLGFIAQTVESLSQPFIAIYGRIEV